MTAAKSTPPTPPRRAAEPPRKPRSAWSRLFVILGLTGFAISQPLLSALGDNPAVFSFDNVKGISIVWFVLALAFVPPLVLWGVGEGVRRIDQRVGEISHVAVVGLLVLIVGLEVGKTVLGFSRPIVLLAFGAAVCAAIVYLYVRFDGVRVWLQFTAILPFAAVALFLFASSSSALIRSPSLTTVATPGRSAAQNTNLVFILLDELPEKSLLTPSGDLDRARFPNISGLAEGSTWFRNYTALSPQTESAVPALLAGEYPSEKPPVFDSFPNNLFTLLAPTHDLEAFETVTQLCGVPGCVSAGSANGGGGIGKLAGRTLDLWKERIDPAESDDGRLDDFTEDLAPATNNTTEVKAQGQFSNEALMTRMSRVDAFVSSLAEQQFRPRVSYLHVMSPHQPWRLYPDGQIYTTEIGDPVNYPYTIQNDLGEWVRAVTEQRHLLQLGYADALVGQVVDELKANGRYDDTMIVLTADHGISFEAQTPTRQYSPDGVDGLAYVPLFIKAPKQTEAKVDTSNLWSVDLLPTIAKAMDTPVTFHVDGFAAGSDEIKARGTTKRFYDLKVGNAGQLTMYGTHEFDGSQPEDTSSRLIGPIREGADPIEGLVARAGLADLYGHSLTEAAGARPDPQLAGLQAEVSQLEALQNPTPDLLQPVLINGRVPGAPDDATVVIAVDDQIIGGSPLYTFKDRPQTFLGMLPSKLIPKQKKLTFALERGDTITAISAIQT